MTCEGEDLNFLLYFGRGHNSPINYLLYSHVNIKDKSQRNKCKFEKERQVTNKEVSVMTRTMTEQSILAAKVD